MHWQDIAKTHPAITVLYNYVDGSKCSYTYMYTHNYIIIMIEGIFSRAKIKNIQDNYTIYSYI